MHTHTHTNDLLSHLQYSQSCNFMELSQPSNAMLQGQQQPSSAAAQAAAATQYFANRAAAAAGSLGLIRTEREHLSDLENKLTQARQRFQDLKEEKCNASSKGCECACCPHAYMRACDQKATSIGPESRSVSETSNLPGARKAGGGRQHLTRSVKSLSSQDTTMGAEHGSPNSEGLLLAVDKFLSMK